MRNQIKSARYCFWPHDEKIRPIIEAEYYPKNMSYQCHRVYLALSTQGYSIDWRISHLIPEKAIEFRRRERHGNREWKSSFIKPIENEYFASEWKKIIWVIDNTFVESFLEFFSQEDRLKYWLPTLKKWHINKQYLYWLLDKIDESTNPENRLNKVMPASHFHSLLKADNLSKHTVKEKIYPYIYWAENLMNKEK